MVSRSNRDFNMTTLIENMIGDELLNVRTCIPVIVTNVGDGTVDAEIVVQRVFENAKSQGVAALLGIPVIHFGSADYNIAFPIAIGDEGLVLFNDRDVQQFFETGKQSAPATIRNHDLSDAVYLPVNVSRGKRTGNIEADTLVLRAGSSSIKITKDGGIDVVGVLDVDGDITATGDITTATGDIVAGTISLKNHIHTSGGSGNPSSVPIP